MGSEPPPPFSRNFVGKMGVSGQNLGATLLFSAGDKCRVVYFLCSPEEYYVTEYAIEQFLKTLIFFYSKNQLFPLKNSTEILILFFWTEPHPFPKS